MGLITIILKKIKGFDKYYINSNGDIYSTHYKKFHKMKPWVDSRGLYVQIGLSVNGKVHKKLVHRLVAEAFIPNIENLPEVNHKDKNTQNNCVDNLEWCDRVTNLKQSYDTMSPVRNYIECSLYKDNIFIKNFKSKTEACRYASENFGCSYSMINKHGKHKNCKIVNKV